MKEASEAKEEKRNAKEKKKIENESKKVYLLLYINLCLFEINWLFWLTEYELIKLMFIYVIKC